MNNSTVYFAASVTCEILSAVDRFRQYDELFVHMVWDLLGQFTLAETAVRKVSVQSRCATAHNGQLNCPGSIVVTSLEN